MSGRSRGNIPAKSDLTLFSFFFPFPLAFRRRHEGRGINSIKRLARGWNQVAKIPISTLSIAGITGSGILTTEKRPVPEVLVSAQTLFSTGLGVQYSLDIWDISGSCM